MPQMKARQVMPGKFVTVTLVTLFAVGLAFGQSEPRMKIEVPFEFTFGSTVLPAGTYTVYKFNNLLAVKSDTSGPLQDNIITWLSGPGPAELLNNGSLVFDNTDGKRVLSEAWIPGIDGILVHTNPKAHSREVLLGVALSQTRTVSGKVAYSLTCGRCHGPDGNGNEQADKFFNTTIPRLSSAEVQAMSDADLKKQITQGGSLMPPVEIEESGFRHRLPPQDVEAVIAYVRTLKR